MSRSQRKATAASGGELTAGTTRLVGGRSVVGAGWFGVPASAVSSRKVELPGNCGMMRSSHGAHVGLHSCCCSRAAT
eukprot:1562084-Pyramimonas_sp.AAC.1